MGKPTPVSSASKTKSPSWGTLSASLLLGNQRGLWVREIISWIPTTPPQSLVQIMMSSLNPINMLLSNICFRSFAVLSLTIFEAFNRLTVILILVCLCHVHWVAGEQMDRWKSACGLWVNDVSWYVSHNRKRKRISGTSGNLHNYHIHNIMCSHSFYQQNSKANQFRIDSIQLRAEKTLAVIHLQAV